MGECEGVDETHNKKREGVGGLNRKLAFIKSIKVNCVHGVNFTLPNILSVCVCVERCNSGFALHNTLI